MLRELEDQITDIREGKTKRFPIQYGHAVGVIAQMGQTAWREQRTEQEQIEEMRAMAKREIVRYGPDVLKYLRKGLCDLIRPEDMDELTRLHQVYLEEKKKEGSR